MVVCAVSHEYDKGSYAKLVTKAAHTFFPLRCSQGLARLPLYERQQVRVDHVSMSGHHAVREAGINLERAMLEQLNLQQ